MFHVRLYNFTARFLHGLRSLGRPSVICPLPQSFPSALHAFLKHSNDFKTAILATLRAGGDNAGRGAMLGSWLGAHLGVDAIPGGWRTRLTAAPRISAALDKILLDEAR